MRSAAVLSVVCLGALGGCFFIDPINERPSGAIRWTAVEVFRGSPVHLDADVSDPDGDRVRTRWRVMACGGAVGRAEPKCVLAESYDDEARDGDYRWSFTAPYVVPSGGSDLEIARTMRIELDVLDDRGAPASTRQTLEIALASAGPSSTGVTASWHGVPGEEFPVDVPIRLRVAKTTSFPIGMVTVDGAVFHNGAPVAAPPLVPVSVGASADDYDLRPRETGMWRVDFVLQDPAGTQLRISKTLQILADQHACLDSYVPRFPGPLLIDAPRRFTVLAVDDEKDPYPASPFDDGVMGVARFQWSISAPAAPGAPRVWAQVAGHDGPDLLIDPTRFAPGDVFSVRVDALDRIVRDPCDASNDSCSQRSDNCPRRVTWTVEVR